MPSRENQACYSLNLDAPTYLTSIFLLQAIPMEPMSLETFLFHTDKDRAWPDY